ncbi:MAG: hypothetical protein JXQ90_08660 [Cyclobacteriaceae bacterium]
MKVYSNITIILFLVNLLISQLSFAQNLPPNSHYAEATIGMKDFKKYKIKNLEILTDSISYDYNKRKVVQPFGNINYIRIREGSKAKGGAIIGGSSAFILIISSILQVQSNPDLVLRDNIGEVTLLTTALGTGVGALIGSSINQEKSYYLHADF